LVAAAEAGGSKGGGDKAKTFWGGGGKRQLFDFLRGHHIWELNLSGNPRDLLL